MRPTHQQYQSGLSHSLIRIQLRQVHIVVKGAIIEFGACIKKCLECCKAVVLRILVIRAFELCVLSKQE